METRQQRLIREALEHDGSRRKEPAAAQEGERGAPAAPEATLRDKSLEHTDADYVPRTLTPHEWEAYYAEHGVPQAHRRGTTPERPLRSGILQRLLRLLRPR